MAQKPNNLPIIIAAIAAVSGVVILNVLQARLDPNVLEQQEEQKAQKAAADQQKSAQALQAAQAPASAGANDVVTWGAEKILGKPGGTPKVKVGWEWTPTIQGNPGAIYDAVDSVQKAMPGAEVDVINLDAKPGATPFGISVNGSLRVSASPNGTFPPPEGIGHMLSQK